jgi:hypothetical protein
VELLIKIKTLISTYSYDQAIDLLDEFLNEKTSSITEKTSTNEYQLVKEAFDLIFHIIELKGDNDLKNKNSIKKIKFLALSNDVGESIENINEIESYLKRTEKHYIFVVNIYWQALYKIGELERATIFAGKYLNELLKYKHYCLLQKSIKKFQELGIQINLIIKRPMLSDIRLESHLEKCSNANKKFVKNELLSLLYETILFFDDERIIYKLSELAVEMQDKNLILAIEKYVTVRGIKNKKIEFNINKFGNFPDQLTTKQAGDFDFADDLFTDLSEKTIKKPMARERGLERERVEFSAEERLLYLKVDPSEVEKNYLNLKDDEGNFLELSSFFIELGLNRKALSILEKYLVLNIEKDQRRALYFLYIKALLLCGERSLADKMFNDFSLNSSLSTQEKNSLQILFKQLDKDSP